MGTVAAVFFVTARYANTVVNHDAAAGGLKLPEIMRVHDDPVMIEQSNSVSNDAVEPIQMKLNQISNESAELLSDMIKVFKNRTSKTDREARDEFPSSSVPLLPDREYVVGYDMDVSAMSDLCEAVGDCKENLSVLIVDIEGTEKVIDSEIKNYNTNIHTKLLAMLRNER